MYRHEERARQIDSQRDRSADTKREGNANRAHRLTPFFFFFFGGGGRGGRGINRKMYKERDRKIEEELRFRDTD